jgi:hypothetical protein
LKKLAFRLIQGWYLGLERSQYGSRGFLERKETLEKSRQIVVTDFLHGWDNRDNGANYAKNPSVGLAEQFQAHIVPY